MSRDIIPRTVTGLSFTPPDFTGADALAKSNPPKESDSGMSVALIAMIFGGAVYIMSKTSKRGFSVSYLDYPAQARIWLDRVERQAHRTSSEFKNLSAEQKEAVEDVRMCAESAMNKFPRPR